mgnify:CR=1 FL=1
MLDGGLGSKGLEAFVLSFEGGGILFVFELTN